MALMPFHVKMGKDGKMANGEGKKEKMVNGEMKEGRGMKERPMSWGMGMMMGDSVAMARQSAKEAEGKTMKQLSRLHRYQGGMRPLVGEEMTRNGMSAMMRGEKVM